MLKATLMIAALGLAHAGVVPSVPQQYLAQGPAPTYIASPALPAGLAQQARALPPIYRTAAPAQAIPQQALYRAAPAAPVQYAPAPQYAAAPVQYAPAPTQYAAAPVQYAPAPAPAAPIQDYQRQALAAQRVVQARPQPAAAAPQRRPAAGQQPAEEDYDPNPAYNFSFDVKDDVFTNYQNRKESREGDQIKGSYSVVDSDGFIRTVTYTADPVGGFKAEVIREPTDIKVVLPTPAPAPLASQRLAAPARAAAPQYAPAPQYAAAPQQYQQYQPAGVRVAQQQAYPQQS